MPSRKRRAVQHRRDRRKAKASRWRRQPKAKMGVVCHGPTGIHMWGQRNQERLPAVKPVRKLKPYDRPRFPMLRWALESVGLHAQPVHDDSTLHDAQEQGNKK